MERIEALTPFLIYGAIVVSQRSSPSFEYSFSRKLQKSSLCHILSLITYFPFALNFDVALGLVSLTDALVRWANLLCKLLGS